MGDEVYEPTQTEQALNECWDRLVAVVGDAHNALVVEFEQLVNQRIIEGEQWGFKLARALPTHDFAKACFVAEQAHFGDARDIASA
jgi:hypothetical protein